MTPLLPLLKVLVITKPIWSISFTSFWLFTPRLYLGYLSKVAFWGWNEAGTLFRRADGSPVPGLCAGCLIPRLGKLPPGVTDSHVRLCLWTLHFSADLLMPHCFHYHTFVYICFLFQYGFFFSPKKSFFSSNLLNIILFFKMLKNKSRWDRRVSSYVSVLSIKKSPNQAQFHCLCSPTSLSSSRLF